MGNQSRATDEHIDNEALEHRIYYRGTAYWQWLLFLPKKQDCSHIL
jgi:hypothetical protein